MISLKNIRDKMGQVEGYIKTDEANAFISSQGIVSSTQNLAGLPLEHYNCGGTCSWTCSGSCSHGAGGGTFSALSNVHLLSVNASLDDGQGIYIDLLTGTVTLWVENDTRAKYIRVQAMRTGQVWENALVGVGSNNSNGYDWSDPAKRRLLALHDTAAFSVNAIEKASYIQLSVVRSSGRSNIVVNQQPSAANGYTGTVLVTDPSNGGTTNSYDVFLTAT